MAGPKPGPCGVHCGNLTLVLRAGIPRECAQPPSHVRKHQFSDLNFWLRSQSYEQLQGPRPKGANFENTGNAESWKCQWALWL